MAKTESLVFAPETDVDGAVWDIVEYQGKSYQTRIYSFEDEDGEVDGVAALEEFGDIIRDKHGEPVNDEAGEVDAEIGCYIPRDIFYADEQTFIEYISREHYDGLPLVG